MEKGKNVAGNGFFSLRDLKKMGVTVRGGGVCVSRSAKVWRGATLCGPCSILGESTVCEGSVILPFTAIEGSFIGRGATVNYSVCQGARIGEGSTVGPFAFLRGGTVIGKNCRVGDFVEVKNSVLGNGTKAAHHAYIGDADVGSDVNIGCGVVFANYDGKTKSRTKVGDGCFIGCNCNIVAPVCIGKGAYIAAGTTVTEDVAPLALCIGRSRQKAKPRGAEGRYKNG